MQNFPAARCFSLKQYYPARWRGAFAQIYGAILGFCGGFMGYIAIGDVHGHLGALDSLLDKVLRDFRADDTLIFLGDYIDDGPDSRGCVQRVIDLKKQYASRVVALMGNHEQWLLRTLADYTHHNWLFGMQAFPTVRSYSSEAETQLRGEIRNRGWSWIRRRNPLDYGCFFSEVPSEHIEFLRGLQPSFRGGEYLFTHGGLDPGFPLRSQSPSLFIWGSLDFPLKYRGALHVVYGHRNNAVRMAGRPFPRIHRNTYGIDTVLQGVLTAVRFPEVEVLQSEPIPEALLATAGEISTCVS